MSNYQFGAVAAEPVQAVQASRVKQYNWLGIINLLGLVVLAFAMLRGSASPTPPPGPGPGPQPEPSVIVEDVVAVFASATKQMIENEAKISDRLAEDVLTGKIQNSNQFYEMAKAYTEKGEEVAFKEANVLNKKYITESGDKGWSESDKKLIAELQKRKAQGKRKALK